jgi:hypothetical protein
MADKWTIGDSLIHLAERAVEIAKMYEEEKTALEAERDRLREGLEELKDKWVSISLSETKGEVMTMQELRIAFVGLSDAIYAALLRGGVARKAKEG